MAEPKVTLNMLIPGSTLYNQEECNKDIDKCNVDKVTLTDIHKSKKKVTKTTEVLTVITKKAKPAKQVIKMSLEAYNSMITKQPEGLKMGPIAWKNLSKKQRLEANLKLIAESFNAISYTYHILED